MTIKYGVLAVPLVMVALTAGASAADIDTNDDGLYSFPEMEAAFPDMGVNAFLEIDSDADGRVDDAELAQALDSGLLDPPPERTAAN
ncbi:hypothetical protein SAMN04490244_104287 [Tranquillimonas rosea]|uniref:EF-hand domain-containing protein n=1 Tax=Tranquillimonas rosea TaxID=641238 RepID=A0A1H9TNJ5_9RHOB|nr:hypothetical protein [Tranquillimonas rosea]SER98691.1 hypothetical protein SAMN04490244_104287 [Tranquillimonas rosea]